jgi:hypothetical protein
MNRPDISLKLSRPEALVFFEMLARLDSESGITFADAAEQQVLWSLEAQLEKSLTEPLASNYQELLEQARRTVRGRGR